LSLPAYVEIGQGILSSLPDQLDQRDIEGKAFIIADTTVGALYGDQIRRLLRSSGKQVAYMEIPPGETAKGLHQTSKLYNWLYESHLERDDFLIALGGGVIGDLVGYVAATYMRGLRWAQIATSLLAQVDSSIGGKVGIDLPGGKNLIGAFHPPTLSLLDIDLLASLPHNQLTAGWAEVIKHGTILDSQFFQMLEHRIDDPADPDLLLLAVRRCVEIKAAIVQEDPFDRGRRAILNYGHTMGHAIEVCTGYKGYLHGEAVSIGMAGAASIAHQLGLIAADVEERQNTLLERNNLPLKYEGIEPDELIRAMKHDKKVSDGHPRWVLLEGLGQATVNHTVEPGLTRAMVMGLRQ
jgi:3-dehydroquinate synthase